MATVGSVEHGSSGDPTQTMQHGVGDGASSQEATATRPLPVGRLARQHDQEARQSLEPAEREGALPDDSARVGNAGVPGVNSQTSSGTQPSPAGDPGRLRDPLVDRDPWRQGISSQSWDQWHGTSWAWPSSGGWQWRGSQQSPWHNWQWSGWSDSTGNTTSWNPPSTSSPADAPPANGATPAAPSASAAAGPLPPALGSANPSSNSAINSSYPASHGGAAAAPSPAPPTSSTPTQWSSWNWAPGWSPWYGSGGGWNNQAWQGSRPDPQPKADFADPPSWPGWSFRKHWVAAARRWNKGTDVPLHRRSEKVLRILGWEMMADFEHLTETELAQDDYLEKIIGVLESKAGVREDDEKRQSFRSIFQDSQRKKDETLAQFSIRREKEFQKASSFGMDLPASLKATLLIEGAHLSDQNQQNLVAILQGRDEDPVAVARALSRLDIRGDRLIGFATEEEEAQETYLQQPDSDTPSDSDFEKAIAEELNEMNLTEDQVMEVYAVLETKKKRTWKENKQFKAEARKDRGSFMKSEAGSSAPRGRHGGVPGTGFKGNRGRNRMSREQLKKISNCRRCLKKGHWEEDCTAPPKVAAQKTQGFTFSYLGELGGADPKATFLNFFGDSAWRSEVRADVQAAIQEVLARQSLKSALEAINFLTIPSGEAIVDIGATQDLIGESAAQQLEEQLHAVGLRTVSVPCNGGSPSGIGGPAKVSRAMLVPISPGGVPGVLYMTVLSANIPPLLSVGLLEHLGAKIDLEFNTMELKAIDRTLPMRRLHTGHRCISLIEWCTGEVFPIPEEAARRHKIGEGVFNIKASCSPSSYVEKGAQSSESWHASSEFSTTLTSPSATTTTTTSIPTVVHDFVEPNQNVSASTPSTSSCHAVLLNDDEKSRGSSEMSVNNFLSSCPEQRTEQDVAHLTAAQASDICHLMGGQVSLQPLQFAQCTSLSHGTSSQAKCAEFSGGKVLSCSESMATPDDQGLLHSRGHQDHVLSIDDGREQQEHQLRQDHLCKLHRTDEQGMSSSGEKSPQARQPVCGLDPVRKLWSSDVLPEEVLSQGQTKGQSIGNFHSCRSNSKPLQHGIQSDVYAIDANTGMGDFIADHSGAGDEYGPKDQIGLLHGNAGHLQDGAAYDELHGRHQLSECPDSERHAGSVHLIAGTCPGSRTSSPDVADSISTGPECPRDSGDGQPADVRDGVGGERRVGAHGKSQPRRWPLWLAACSGMSTSLFLSGNQLSEGFLSRLQEHDLTKDVFAFQDPSFLEEDILRKAPTGIMSQFVPPGCYLVEQEYSADQPPSTIHQAKEGDQVLWRETKVRNTGEVLFKGPVVDSGIPSPASEKAEVISQWWVLPSRLAKIFQWASSTSDIAGFGEDGSSSASGPYWVIHSPELGDQLQDFEGREMPTSRLGSDLLKCERNLCFLSRGGKSQKQLDFVEIFSPPRVSIVVQKMGLDVPKEVFDLQHGWDVREQSDRELLRNVLRERRPNMAMFSPECKAYSQLMNVNWEKMQPLDVRKILTEGQLMWDFSLEGCHQQLANGLHFGLEHPSGASSWKLRQTQSLIEREDVALISFDQCAFGLQVDPAGELSRKRTKVATSNPHLAVKLLEAQCDHSHEHRHLEHGLPAQAQVYPPKLCQAIAESVQKLAVQAPCPTFWITPSFATEEVEPNEDEEMNGEPMSESLERTEATVSSHQKQMIMKVHINTGHPPMDQFLRMMRAAGAHEHVLKYIRDEFKCDQCSTRNRPANRRRAHCPRSFSFNKVLSVDVFYVKFQEIQVPILNMVCAGTNYHVACRLPHPDGSRGGAPTSHIAWKIFLETWIRYLGAPQMVITDSGNEFKGRFERGCESLGILQHVITPECPWENAKAERHGGWLKDRLDKEVLSGNCSFASLAELDEFLASLTATKNRWFSRGGYTPTALVFGELPRVPGELLSDDHPGLCGLDDSLQDPLGTDEASREFKRRFELREKAKQAATSQTSKEAVSRAVRSATHQTLHWSPGQWVYVYRRGRPSQELHPRDRWCGPGVVLLANNRTIYVAMRSRLWRCSPEQLRAALPAEVLGREIASDPGLSELIRQVTSGVRTGAVDVVREGPPPAGTDYVPVERAEHGVEQIQHRPPDEVPVGVIQQREPVSIPSAPREVVSVSPGILAPGQPSPTTQPSASPSASAGFPSRQVSEDEPASEPSAIGPPPGLPPIPEQEETSPRPDTNPRSLKTARTSEEINVDAPVSHIDAQGSETQEGVRAPGTPVGRLLSRIPGRASGQPRTPSPTRLTPVEHGTHTVCERVAEFERLRERSPRRRQPLEEEDEQLFCFEFSDEAPSLQCMAKRNDEISLKELSQAEREQFEKSDKLEWDTILETKAVKVLLGKEADEVRRKFPHRIVSSRMVRRKKPLPEMHKWKAKSRWCVHGHADPDTGSLITYAPTPQAEGMATFLQASVNLGFRTSFGDIKNAFCQSRPMNREKGPLFAEPCEGLNLPQGALIAIIIPIYGLDDAPASWRQTVTEFLIEQGYQRNLVEPCWFSKFHEKTGQPLSQVLVEVDDFIISTLPSLYQHTKDVFMSRFKFGKWEDDEAEYAGRHVRCTRDAVYLDQHKYITENIHPITIAKHRKGDKKQPLNEEEFQQLRSLIYRINWVARETRPEVAGTASIMASKLHQAVVQDLYTINEVVNFLRSTSTRPITLWKFQASEMTFLMCSDAGGINTKEDQELVDEDGLPCDATQGAWMVLACERLPTGTRSVRASPLAWRSSKLKRKVFSTFGGETQAMLQGVNEVDWLQIMYRDATAHDVQLRSWRSSLCPHMVVMRHDVDLPERLEQCAVTDAKSLYDCLLRGNPSGRQDRKSALELAIILKDLQESKSMIRWVPHQKMLVDVLTKESIKRGNGALVQFLKTGWLSLVDVQQELQHRREDVAYRRRSQKACSERLLKEYEGQMYSFCNFLAALATESGGNCETFLVYPNGMDC